MMNHDLIERYIYAVTKRIPPKIKADVGKELHSLIFDMLDERCGDITPTEKDVRLVLTELGTPSELAEKYSPHSGKCLIGAPYYAQYLFILKIVLASTVLGITIAIVVTTLLSPTPPVWFSAVAQWLTAIPTSFAFAFSFVTLLFAYFYHKGIHLHLDSDSLDHLPPVPQSKPVFSKGESIFGIAFSIIATAIFLLMPQIISVASTVDGHFIPVFNIDVVRSSWYFILPGTAFCILTESIKLIDAKYTRRLMFVTIATNSIVALLSFCWLSNRNMFSAEYLSMLTGIFEKENDWIASIFTHFSQFCLTIIFVALLIDTAVTIFKTFQSGELTRNTGNLTGQD